MVYERIRDIVGGVKTNQSREKGPSAKCTGRERAHGTRWRGVDAGGVGSGEVGLKTIQRGDEGDLEKVGG